MGKKDIPRCELKLKCELLVSIPTGNGVFQNVMFNPDAATVALVKDTAKNHPTEYFELHTTDKAGNFVTKRLHRLIKVAEYHGSMTLITLEL